MKSGQINNNQTTNKATGSGFCAVLMWALLALFTQSSGTVPPFQLAAMTFFIGTLVGLVWLYGFAKDERYEKIPPKIAVFGGAGLFAYHALYFAALKNAPAVEASLIAYLWPLLIVVGTALLPDQKFGIHHIMGALLGFVGTVIIVTGGSGFQVNPNYMFGYGLALVAAFTWATYSLAARRVANVSTKAVIYYCAISTVLSCVAHFAFETTIMPENLMQWAAILGLGLLPVGAAFYVWDYGMKRGDVAIIGASSYAAPLLSTIILVIVAGAGITWSISLACLLITFGAVLAAKDLLFKR